MIRIIILVLISIQCHVKGHNKLHSLHGRTFYYLNALRDLDVSFNRLRNLHVTSLLGLRNIRRLKLNNNYMETVPTAALQVTNVHATRRSLYMYIV